MKVKQRPDDFRVEERTDVVPAGGGPFAFYRLEKRGRTTPDALADVRRRWRIEPRRLSYGGLKDRHAVTVQYLTIFHGPRRGLNQEGVRLTYLGQVARPYTSTDIRANHFRVTLRALTPEEVAGATAALGEVRRDGVPNYFDDQRFGSVSAGGEFLGRLLVDGRFEDALRLALTEPYEYDRADQKREKALVRRHWGEWAALRERLPPGHARDLIDGLLRHPGDFRGAVARLRPELHGLYLSAYQSYLWNRVLARWVEGRCRPEQIVLARGKLGELPMWRALDEGQRRELAGLALPLPSARMKLADDDPRAPLVHAVLAEEGLEARRMQVKGVRELFFSKGERPTLCLPGGLTSHEGDDDLNAGHRRLTLTFELPRGSYATLIVKRLQIR